ncbi:MAG TPA: DUF58 domain-containing protein [Planctomycetota bacterium]|nr:DUF58 domain-containing protein [Planctomycetota bacterium]OQC19389.1 MAG: hypothetical protein BWX69_02739 [Planctomycetes bacterium ADurb.Bin069]HNS00572.1 DUF58 domain-containing protein [Planctomycetota bacterium]HNU27415.1 DUF58 domain-containing protein [Planctomycetota bacterium]HOE31189.1 DUF58 domain-containing protein [Planctomycetota bacterium]
MTSPAFALLAALPFFILAGLHFRNGPLLFVAGVLLFLLGASWAFGGEAKRRIACRRSAHPRAFEGAPADVRLALANHSGFPLLGAEVIDRFDAQDLLPKELAVPVDVRPRHTVEISYTGLCLRHRGEYALGPVAVRFYDPLGLFLRTRRFSEQSRFAVLPKPLPLARLGLEGRSALLSAANPDRQTRGESIKFYGVREYRSGDSLRHVHWKASARLARLVVRQFEASVSSQITIFLDLARANLAGTGAEATVEYAIRAAAAIAAAAVAQGHEIQLFAEGESPFVTKLGSGAEHLGYLLRRLAVAKPKGARPLPDIVARHAERVPQGSHVFLILAGGGGGNEKAFARACAYLRGRHASIAALVVDDRTFVQLDRWREELSADPWPPCAHTLVRLGVQVRIIKRGDDLLGRLQER